MPVREVLDEYESELVLRALAILDTGGPSATRGAAHIRNSVGRLSSLWHAVEEFPHVKACQRLGSRERNLETLMTTFLRAERYSLEAFLPTRATLARAYGVAKFNFARMLRYVFDDAGAEVPALAELSSRLTAAERSAAIAIIAEDVLRTIASDSLLDHTLRCRATARLAELWDRRATQSLARFAPLLGSAWRAKAKVRISYGTLAGVSEMFQLLREGCAPEFVDYLSCENATPEQHEALEEFVFNATYEELTRMREFMRSQGQNLLDASKVAELFEVGLDELHTTTGTAENMFFTFRERESWARHRRLQDCPGPKKTAEEYVMIYVLGENTDAACEQVLG